MLSNFSLRSYHYTHISVHLSVLIREPSFCSRWRLVVTRSWLLWENKRLWSATINGMSVSHSLPSKLRGEWRRRGWKIARIRGTRHLQQSIFFWNNTTVAEMNSHGFVCGPKTCRAAIFIVWKSRNITKQRQWSSVWFLIIEE